MDRRRFLSTTMLSGVGLAAGAAVATPARALEITSCDAAAGTPACVQLLRHHELLAQLRASLAARGLSPAQQQAVLAKAICPFCGQPLIG